MYYNNLIIELEKKSRDDIRNYRNKVLKEIGEKIVDIQDLLLIEKFEIFNKYIEIFDEIIENVSNAKTINALKVFEDYFKSEYINLLKEFKEEYIKKYKMLSHEIDINSFDKVSTLYKKLKNVKSE